MAKNEERDTMTVFVRQLLDSYFLHRDSLPTEGYIRENKTTQEIQDDLMPMVSVTKEEIVSYMMEHEYDTTTEQNGSVSWAIWRRLNAGL